MQDKFNQFERNQVWSFTAGPKDHPMVRTKWVFRNRLYEFGAVIRNKAQVVAKDHNQEEGI